MITVPIIDEITRLVVTEKLTSWLFDECPCCFLVGIKMSLHPLPLNYPNSPDFWNLPDAQRDFFIALISSWYISGLGLERHAASICSIRVVASDK